MPLPKITAPTYELVLPSSGRKCRYRPFLVKEEKLLIIAMESEDTKQITTAVQQVLKNCILTRGIKVEKLATFDIEYLFLNIRGKSVGEEVEVMITCPDDGETQVPAVINLDDIKINETKGHTRDIKIDDTLSLRMKYPSMDEFVKNIEISLHQLDITKNKGLAEGLSNVFIENMNKLLEERDHKINELELLKNKKEETMWLEELEELKKQYDLYKIERKLRKDGHIKKKIKIKKKTVINKPKN